MIPKLPPPAGTVLRYSYLWAREAEAGREEGVKDRPAALLLAQHPDDGRCVIVPITHSPPTDMADAVEIPEEERARLGLASGRAWIVVSEFNSFRWPGFDLRAIPGRKPTTVIYGKLSRGPFTQALTRMKALLREHKIAAVPRA